MRLITLNIWGGRISEPLFRFIENHAETDIFCFQEVFNEASTSRPVHKESLMDLFGRIADLLPGHAGYFAEEQANEEGMAIFIKKVIPVRKNGSEFVFRWHNAMENDDARTMGRAVQYAVVDAHKKSYFIGNFHGLWNGQGKTDTPDRVSQSKNIKQFLDSFSGPKILAGDFNLLPDTESLGILEQGMRNLIKEYGIASTRSSLYKKESKFADYVLTSPEVKVSRFEVLQDEISDHLPILVAFE